MSLFWGIFFFLSVAGANGNTLVFPSEEFENSWLKIYPAGELESKPGHRGTFRHILENAPQGKLHYASPPGCSNLALEKEMAQDPKPDSPLRFQILQNFLTRCEKPLTAFYPGKYTPLLRLANSKVPLGGRPYLKELVLKLPYNIVVHALLALKNSDTPRPMVIFNCSTGCDLSSTVARLFLAEIFDETPFNVLILPSLSGEAFIKNNRGFGLGGFEEGRLTFEVVRLLGGSDSPFSRFISSFHIFGVSLGGNGSLFAGIYGTYNNAVLKGPKIQSVSAYCPVVDLRTSLEDLDRNDFTGRHFSDVIKKTITKNFAFVSGSDHDLPELYKSGQNQSIPFIEKFILPAYQGLSKLPNFNIPPFTHFDFTTGEAFWKANNFLNYYSTINIPSLLVYSKDDFIVLPKHNSQKLEEELASNPNSNVNVIHFDKGSHCAAMEIYGEDIVIGMMKNFILSHSPEFNFSESVQTLPLYKIDNSQKTRFIFSGEKYFGYKWIVKQKATAAKLQIKIWSPSKNILNNGYNCSRHDPYYAFEGCFRLVELKVPLTHFFADSFRATTQSQAQVFTRWLNSRVHLFNARGVEPVDTAEAPDYIQWIPD